MLPGSSGQWVNLDSAARGTGRPDRESGALIPPRAVRAGRFAVTRQALDTLSAASVGSLHVGDWMQ